MLCETLNSTEHSPKRPSTATAVRSSPRSTVAQTESMRVEQSVRELCRLYSFLNSNGYSIKSGSNVVLLNKAESLGFDGCMLRSLLNLPKGDKHVN